LISLFQKAASSLGFIASPSSLIFIVPAACTSSGRYLQTPQRPEFSKNSLQLIIFGIASGFSFAIFASSGVIVNSFPSPIVIIEVFSL